MLVMITRVVDFQDREFSGRKQTRTIRNCANVMAKNSKGFMSFLYLDALLWTFEHDFIQ